MTRLLYFIVFAFTAIILFSQPVVAQKQPLILKPTSQWIASYDDDSCRLLRQFGSEDKNVLAIFSRFGPGDGFRLTLGGKPVKLRSDKRAAKLQFGPSEKEQDVHFFIGSLGEDRPALVFQGLLGIAAPNKAPTQRIRQGSRYYEPLVEPVSAERQAAVKYLTVGRPLKQSVQLELGSMAKPFAALSTCIDELMTNWGIDVEKHKTLSRTAQPASDPGRWVIPNDYPTDMLSRGQPAVVQFRVDIGPAGEINGCHIQKTTRPKDFDDAVCKSLMKRAQFLPALDAEGNPIASYWQSTVQFQIPR